MSSIFGILNLDGRPVEPGALSAMRDRLAQARVDGTAIWQNDNVGLGHVQLLNTPESRVERLPRRDAASGVVLTAHVRLDNRAELIASGRGQMEMLDHLPSAIPDSDLILYAYLRWGEECVHHLLGDWAFAIWDPRDQKLFLARDQHGISAIHYYYHAACFMFASSIKGLLALPEIPQRPNRFRLAQILTAWSGDGVQTAYEGILRLPPAHTLTVTIQPDTPRRYWHPEKVAPLRFASDAEYVEAFLSVYGEAVRCRLRSDRPVGATLSSGLDSGSICALIARELRACGERLPVFTSVPMHDITAAIRPTRYGDESALVEVDRQFIGNLDVHYLRAEDITPLAGIERHLAVRDEPGHAAGNMFWIIAMLQAAQTAGLGTFLTGQMGNGISSWGGHVENLWPLLLSGHWRKFWTRAKKFEPSPWKRFKRYVLRPFIQPLRDQLERQRSRGGEPWMEYSAINPDLAGALKLSQRMAASGHDPFFQGSSDPMHTRLRIIQPGRSINGAVWSDFGAAYGMEVRDPTTDKRLIEFCLAIPDDQFRQDGMDRALIRRAMAGLLPDAVRLNPRRGLQAADIGYRVLAALPETESLLARLRQSALAREVLDLPKMSEVVLDMRRQVNPANNEQSRTILLRGLMVGLFLLRFEGGSTRGAA